MQSVPMFADPAFLKGHSRTTASADSMKRPNSMAVEYSTFTSMAAWPDTLVLPSQRGWFLIREKQETAAFRMKWIEINT